MSVPLPKPIVRTGAHIAEEIAPGHIVLIPSPTQIHALNPQADLTKYYAQVNTILKAAEKKPNPAIAANQAQKQVVMLQVPQQSPLAAPKPIDPKVIGELLRGENSPPVSQAEATQLIKDVEAANKVYQEFAPTQVKPTVTTKLGCVDPGHSINPFDWMRYWACILANSFDGLNTFLSNTETGIVNTLWNGLPDFLKTAITDMQTFIKSLQTIHDNPQEFVNKTMKATVTSLNELKGANQIDIFGDATKGINDLMKDVTNYFDSPLTPAEADKRAVDTSLLALGVESGLFALAAAPELLPLENFTGLAFLIGQLADSLNTRAYIGDYWARKYDANVSRQVQKSLNSRYPNEHLDRATLLNLYVHNRIERSELDSSLAESGSLNPSRIDKLIKSTQMVPSLEDFMTWNTRHPSEAYDLNTLGAFLGLDFDRYYKVFHERLYGDLGIRQLQVAFDVLDLSEVQVREILRLARIDPTTT